MPGLHAAYEPRGSAVLRHAAGPVSLRFASLHRLAGAAVRRHATAAHGQATDCANRRAGGDWRWPQQPIWCWCRACCAPGACGRRRWRRWRTSPTSRVADHTRHDTMAGIAQSILAAAPERFALAGLSMGGYIAYEIVRQAPERVTQAGAARHGLARRYAGAHGSAAAAQCAGPARGCRRACRTS